jgi:hypothetical protein
VGEVIIRNLGGEWQGDDNDPEAEINIAVRFPNGAICWPVQRVIKRFTNGAEDSIIAYGIGNGLQPGARPERSVNKTSKPWWKF